MGQRYQPPTPQSNPPVDNPTGRRVGYDLDLMGGTMTAMDEGQPEPDARVTLEPLGPEEALRALLAIKPDDPPEPDPTTKPPAT